jgi:Polyketide cyclase / dehydrase and lipid transport
MPASTGRWWLTSDSQQIVINADPERIYGLISDLPRMGEWSPECERVEWTGGSTTAAVGARFTGYNRGGPFRLMRWSRRGRVLAADPGREFAFVTEEGGRESTVWRYRFEPVAGGTRVTESYQVRWIPAWARIIDVPTNRHRELREAMRHTLRRLQGAAETPAWAPDQPGTAEGAGIAAAAGTGRAARRPRSPEKESAR